LNHFTSPRFWKCYHALPQKIQELADKNFRILQKTPGHPSLRFRKIGIFRSARVGIQYRALAKERAEGLVWIWIGPHDEYERILSGKA